MDKDDDPLTIGLNRAVALLADAKPRGITLGDHPKGGIVEVRRGRFGPYLMHGTRVANLPRGTEMEAVALDEAIAPARREGQGAAAHEGQGWSQGARAQGGREGARRRGGSEACRSEEGHRKAGCVREEGVAQEAGDEEAGAKKAPARAKAPA
jgi:DNA topoisomerase-1